MARTTIQPLQLKITGSLASAVTTLDDDYVFLTQDAASSSPAGATQTITAAAMQDYFSKMDLRESGASGAYQLVFADDDNEYNGDNATSYSSFQTSRLQESTVTSATTSLTFSPEYGVSAAAGLAVIFTDSSSNKIAFTFDSSVSSSATSVAVTFNAGLSNATTMNKSSISSVTSVTKGSGDGKLRVDGSHLNYNPSTNKMTLAGNLQTARLEIDGTTDYIDVSTDLQIIAAADILLDPGGSDVKVDGNLLPNADDAYDLGSTSAAWQDLHLEGDVLFTDAGKVETAAGALTLSTAASSQNIILDATGDIEINADGGTVSFKDASTTYASITSAGLLPGADDTYDLGSTSAAWQDLHLEGDVLFTDAGKVETAAGALTLSTAASSQNIILDATGDIEINADGGTVSFKDASTTYASITSAGLLPGADDTYDLGSTSAAWQDLHLEGDILAQDAMTVSTAAGGLTIDSIAGTATVDGHTGVTLQSSNSGDILLDSVADIVLDAAGDDVVFKDAGTEIGSVNMASSNLTIKSAVSDKDIIFMGNDGGSSITALTLDMSDAGKATFNGAVVVGGDLTIQGTTTTLDTTNLLVEDPIVVLNKANSSANGQGGIAIENGGSSTDMVIGRVANDTWGVGTKDTSGGEAVTVADMTLGAFRAGKLEIDGANDYIDVDTDLKLIAAADIVLDPGGGDVKVDGNLLPNADDTSDLGSTSAAWQDLHLEGDVLMTDAGKVETAAGALTLSAAGSSQKVIIDAAGDIDLNADSGQIVMKDDSATLFTFAANEIDVASGDLTLDVAGDIILDAAGAQVKPGSNDQAGLGDTSTRWSDLYMADGAILSMGASSYDAKITHSSADRYGDDASSDRLTTSFSAFQATRIQESSLSQSTSALTLSPEVGTSISSGEVIVFQGSGSDKIAFTVSSSVSSGDTSISVSFNSAASSASSLTVNKSDISSTSKDLGAFKSAFTESTISASVTTLNFSSAAKASAFNSKVGSNGTVKIADGSVIATTVLSSYSSGTSIGVSISMSGGSSFSASGIDSMTIKQSAPAHSLTVDGSYASLDLADHDGSEAGLKLAGTLVSATAAELNIMDGDTTAASVTLVAGDGVVLNDGGTMKQALVSDFGTFMSGDGLQVSSGVLAVDAIKDTFLGTGALTNNISASLSQEPLADSVQVFLNGVLQTQSGSSGLGASIFDYAIEGSGSSQKVVFESGVVDSDDAVVIHYIKK